MNVMRAPEIAPGLPRLRYVSFHAFTRDEGRAAVGELNDDRCFNFCSGFQNSVDGISARS